jgi:tripartite-type tricarboxylate transporter receptor subunit TctC
MEDAMQTLSRRAVLTGIAALLLSPRPGTAQDEALRIVFPFSAGGAADGVARLIAEHLRNKLGKAVIVENIVGAGGRIGARAVKDKQPNGTTLLFASSSQMALQSHIYRDLGYDPFDDFVPISQTVRSEIAFAVSSQSQARTIKELIAWFKANPTQALYGSPGIGTGPYFAGVEFARLSGLELRHAPYKGTPSALPDLMAGRIPLYIALAAELIEQHRSGDIRILATADAARSPFLPDVPTLRESGLAIEAPRWFAFYAPARTPGDVVERLEKEIVAATNLADTRTKIMSMGYQPTGTTSETLRKIQREDFARWGTIVKASGFKAEP